MSIDARNAHAVHHATEADFGQIVLKSSETVLVDFYADWCVPCQMLSPTLAEFANENPNVRVVKVNVDENPNLASDYGVSSIPNLIVFKDGKVAASHLGLASKAQLDRLVSR